jgi:hypothetical protein
VTAWVRPRLALHVVLAAAAVSFAAGIGWELSRSRPLPAAPPASGRANAPVSPGAADPTTRAAAAPTMIATIAARNLFNAARSEVATVVAAPGGPKPVLHGVVMDGEKSRAYVEDPVAKRIFGYAVGDTVGGGRLEQITDDRIVIRRVEGAIEVLLQDSGKARQGTTQPPAPRPTPTPPPPATQGPADKPSQ